jgi:PAS domain S-box-containing protein
MMNFRNRTKDELIKELQKLQQEYDSLKISYEKDIKERKQAEEALNLEKENFRHSLNDSPLGIRIVTHEGNTIYANQTILNYYGYDSLEELQKTSLKKRYTLESYEEAQKRKHQREHGDLSDTNYEICIVRKNGEIRHLQVFRKIVLWDGISQFQIIYDDITGRKKAEEEIKKSRKLLKAHNKHLIEIRENERAQIAINLHDDIGQKLTAMNLNLAWVKSRIGVQSQVVKDKLEDISLLINETYENIRKISSDLRPSILFDFGLIEAIVLQLKKFENQSGIRYSFNYKPAEFKIDTQLSLAIYRILLESLTNIIRHSQATFSEVSLNLIDSRVELVIKDNGKGIEKEKINSLTSMGIMGMKERVRLVNGKILIAGKKGSGTTIKVSIPVMNRKKHDKSTDYR